MLLHVPASLDELLSLLAGVFTQPSLQTFRALVLVHISHTVLRTFTLMLFVALLSFFFHHARAHRFFSDAIFSFYDLFLRFSFLIAYRLCAPCAPLFIAIDDTFAHRRVRNFHFAHFHHDATSNIHRSAFAFFNNFFVLFLFLRLPFLYRIVFLPFLFRLYRPLRNYFVNFYFDSHHLTKPALARELTDLLAALFPARTIHTVINAAYATSASLELPGCVTLTSGLRANAAI